jgi:tRNA(adenine34) deaminase
MPYDGGSSERRVYEFVIDFLLTHNYQPSFREIAEGLDIGSTRTVSDHIERLAEQGLVLRHHAQSRAVGLPHLDLTPCGPAPAREVEPDGMEPPPADEADRHAFWMTRALTQARKAAAEDEVPVGAVLVGPRGSLAEDHNRTRQRSDPTAHAEMLVLRRGARLAGDWRLTDHTLYVTLEPCAMCAGAIVLARLPLVVFGATDSKAGMCGTLGNIVQDARLNHRTELVAGVSAGESAQLLSEFFRARRSRPGAGAG